MVKSWAWARRMPLAAVVFEEVEVGGVMAVVVVGAEVEGVGILMVVIGAVMVVVVDLEVVALGNAVTMGLRPAAAARNLEGVFGGADGG